MSRKISMYLTMRPREAQIFCMKSLKSLNPTGLLFATNQKCGKFRKRELFQYSAGSLSLVPIKYGFNIGKSL